VSHLYCIGTKRFDSEKAGDREVQRTMLELLNQLDGFSSTADIKVIAATNRVDILDPALLRSGRLDRKIEFPHPNEEARARIMQIHSRKMNVSPEVNFEELSRSTDDFNGAQCKAVCVEAVSLFDSLWNKNMNLVELDDDIGIVFFSGNDRFATKRYDRNTRRF
jgi:26S proteasome regulatory subunit T5